jgi:HSP20 family protein
MQARSETMVNTANLRTYEPVADIFRANPFFDVVNLFDTPRMRRAFGPMPVAPEIKMDVTEGPEAFFVKAEIPGVKKEDIHVLVEGNTVSISAEVKRSKEVKEGETSLCTELYEGKVARTFTVMCDLDDTKAEAKYESGILELKLPKKAGGRAKALPVA